MDSLIDVAERLTGLLTGEHGIIFLLILVIGVLLRERAADKKTCRELNEKIMKRLEKAEDRSYELIETISPRSESRGPRDRDGPSR